MAASSIALDLSGITLSSESRASEREALLLWSVGDKQYERELSPLDRATALTLARLIVALRIAETNPNDDPDDDFRGRRFRGLDL